MSEDPRAEIRSMVAAMSPEQLKAALDGILGGGLLDVAPEPHTNPARTVHEAPIDAPLLTVCVDVDGTKPPGWYVKRGG